MLQFNDRIQFLFDEERDPRLVFEFFIVFSRFEYALKRSNFLSPGDRVKADWDKFALQYKDLFNPNENHHLREAVDYYENSPPKKQIADNNRLTWVNDSMSNADPLLTRLNVRLRRVRNNLFHGEKSSMLLDGTAIVQTLDRNRKLLTYGLLILYAMVELDQTVKRYFQT